MDTFFAAIEQSPVSIFMRESLWAFPTALVLHAVGMGVLAGMATATGLRVLGVASRARLDGFLRLRPVIWAGFWLAAVSGVLLLAAYPAKALTNPVFALKLASLAAALALILRVPLTTAEPGGRWRVAAAASLAAWAGAIAAGRLLAYTHTTLLTS
jgi:hypothetical protein